MFRTDGHRALLPLWCEQGPVSLSPDSLKRRIVHENSEGMNEMLLGLGIGSNLDKNIKNNGTFER